MFNKKMIASYLLVASGLMMVVPSFPGAEAREVKKSSMFSLASEYDANQPIYVIGHMKPDSDTACSSIAYANLLKEVGYNATSVLSGKANAETSYALNKYGIPMPELMQDATNKQFILMDHSVYGQSVSGMKQAKVLAVVDHHGIGDVKSSGPMTYIALPVGATSTIVYNQYQLHNAKITKQMAGMMLTGILSDTVGLKSPTTTDFDRMAVKKLMPIAKVKDYRAYTNELIDAGNVYDTLTIEEIIGYDYKKFPVGERVISIGQVQSVQSGQLESIEKQIDAYMEQQFNKLGVDMCFMMMTNLDTFSTKLLCYGNGSLAAAQKAYGLKEEAIVLPNTISRKKQIAPKLLDALK